MQDNRKIFLDSNIVIYAYCNNGADKQQKTKELFIEKTIVISTQVLQEMANTLYRKFKADFHTIHLLLEECVYKFLKDGADLQSVSCIKH